MRPPMRIRIIWSDAETELLLNVIMENNMVKLVKEKTCEKEQVLKMIEKEFHKRGFNGKNPVNIYHRWKHLRGLYLKTKKASFQKGGDNKIIEAFPYYAQLDKMYAPFDDKTSFQSIISQPKVARKSVKTNVKSTTVPLSTVGKPGQMKCGEVIYVDGQLNYFCFLCQHNEETAQMFEKHLYAYHLTDLDDYSPIKSNDNSSACSKADTAFIYEADKLFEFEVIEIKEEFKDCPEIISTTPTNESEIFDTTALITNDCNQVTFECIFCAMSFPKRHTLRKHERYYEKKKFTCVKCNARFCGIKRYSAHNFQCHDVLCPEKIPKTAPTNESEAFDKNKCTCKIKDCPVIISTTQPTHKSEAFDKNKCTCKIKDCPVIISTTPPTHEIEAFDKNKCTCKIKDCPEIISITPTTNESEVFDKQTTALITENQTMFECIFCGTNFAKRHKLLRHERYYKKKKLTCEECNARFCGIVGLTEHNEKCHGIKKIRTIRTYMCHICKLSLQNLKNMRAHMRQHTGERPYQCDICGKGFTIKSSLKNHIHINHMSERPFMCTECGSCYALQRTLVIHAMTHRKHEETPVPCQICSKILKNKERLRIHLKTHSNEKPFKCNICNKLFKLRSGHRQHMDIHSDERRFPCHFCDLSFAQSVGRRGHIRRVHEGIK